MGRNYRHTDNTQKHGYNRLNGVMTVTIENLCVNTDCKAALNVRDAEMYVIRYKCESLVNCVLNLPRSLEIHTCLSLLPVITTITPKVFSPRLVNPKLVELATVARKVLPVLDKNSILCHLIWILLRRGE